MQTAVSVNADSEWDGVAQTIKKGLGKVQNEVEDVKKELRNDMKKIETNLNSKLDGVKNNLEFKLESEMTEMKSVLN